MKVFINDHDYLSQWKDILASRAEEAVQALSEIDGVEGLILGGSIGRGETWPLSDVDLIPILSTPEANACIGPIRSRLAEQWEREGWSTTLDAGTLYVTRQEVEQALSGPAVEALAETRLYHILDKGVGGQAPYDPYGDAERVLGWIRSVRFLPEVVTYRVNQQRDRIAVLFAQLDHELAAEKLGEANRTLYTLPEVIRTFCMEGWGLRDVSWTRLGTRFERAAAEKGLAKLADDLNEIANLSDARVRERMEAAPGQIRQRHARSYASRLLIGEPVTQVQDARDVLRVFAKYEYRKLDGPPYPEWLGAETEASRLRSGADLLRSACRELLSLSV
ncbi:hypothetical protein J31TS4_25950 [Paenibacillus sp. J31TS4]|uniref:nucleotidyltransferase domain-containing protein n=1 Tax=Paenibacillus sp. J31TS4 TaxID=2807195 RepID=UPI001B2827F1|nr:nucleotidyltransferase domain-containing protein [Paenibacillus sp. J31TS4]GIP39315.1 hypothetical protein J31TS4_25950 [Paenibacillus sp. J31TS4]